MNRAQRNFGVMAAMAMMAATGNSLYEPIPKSEPTPEWKRKKCKSCKFFTINFCTVKSHVKPLDLACEKYAKRK